MRILFTTLPAAGHFQPLVPMARAVAAAGHEVAFATPASYCLTVEAVGFRCFPAGFDRGGVPVDELFPELRRLTGLAYAQFVARQLRVETEARRMVPDLLRVAAAWSPDLIVREATEYGGCVAAEALAIPHASVRTAYSPASFSRRFWVARELDALRAAHGLPPDPEVAMPFRYLHLACEPPGFWPADDPPAPTSHLLRPVPFDRTGDEELPDWVAGLPAAPTICATLGTFVNRATAIFTAIVDGLRDEGVNLILAVGRDIDPAQFGPQPGTVHIERYIPLSLLLPHCDLVIHQAGFGTFTTALLHGLPMVCVPVAADQPDNARRLAAMGVGRVVGAGERTPGAFREAARGVLADPSYCVAAKRVRDQMVGLPGPEHAVALFARLASGKRPIRAAGIEGNASGLSA